MTAILSPAAIPALAAIPSLASMEMTEITKMTKMTEMTDITYILIMTTIVLKSANEYCLFLPRWRGQTIRNSGNSAVAYCNKPASQAPNARILSKRFIRSLNFKHNTHREYVQITGKFNRRSYDLRRHDGGGQYDMEFPPGAKCSGYPYFVELVEPKVERYCLRCCKHKKDCPTHMSSDDCLKVIGGKYH
ncbi:hypothetical protein BGZ90_002646 [Linnemannia elongata]|nr:hypothetical protein BGZ90_002646 [Linnemannia elongata]